MNNFTPEELLEYHYGELNAEQAKQVEDAIKKDWTLREKLSVIQEASIKLDKSFYSPRQEVIDRILKYAETTAVFTSGK